MNIIFVLLPASLLLAGIAVIGYLWASRSGQFDDLDTPALRMLNDDVEDSSKKKRDDRSSSL